MEVEVVSLEKDVCEVKIDNITVAEILRVYLNEQGIKFAVWRREHPTKPVIFRIESSGKAVKKAISEAISGIEKDLDVFLKGLKGK
ncbi:hypothetical protein CMI45_02655 [Candidatus Pacearchaeota archaeon]|jgi:DNA-directed RNA polymerase subunit L|nr:hypothetical protein [Candidatus Pacearchaeota archaeon]|tara:strand:- start:119 stop:376 length:258 start_codon:yes stop_codon:yes gene_type:complete